MANRLSSRGARFIARHEGIVTTAYRCSAGVMTIGCGFTERSRIFKSWWRAKHGRPLRLGDKINRGDCHMLLKKMCDEEYGAAVSRTLPKLRGYEHDACTSVTFNLGTGALKWRWAQPLKSGGIKQAAQILRGGYNRAGGRVLPGLTARRESEARLLVSGDYGLDAPAPLPAKAPAFPTAKKQLAALGYGGAHFARELKRFQKDHPPLVADGQWGPASAAAVQRKLERKRAAQSGGGLAAIGAAAVGGGGLDPASLAIGLASAGVLFGLYQFRGKVLKRRRT
ncbi:lysozyme [Polycladidibacter hongkongensis]|uniref:lysozyme n=1 Tax=Polycladidibacter hongkongensis TaxID=1647556 RepID=UPI0008315E9E|nr:lysozyme [Pseudovibrio hongkongensis]